jgi:hypothetical protein
MKIVIGMATRSNDIYYPIMKFIHAQESNYDLELIFGECGYSAEHAQRRLFGKLRGHKFDYCLLLDSDVVVPDDTLDHLVSCRVDIVSAPVWHFDPMTKDVHLNICQEPWTRMYQKKIQGVEEIYSTSFACLLISRNVFEVFEKANEDLVRWSPKIGNDFRESNTDNIFYEKARSLGFKLNVCWNIKGAIHNRLVSLDDETLTNIINRVKI